MQFIVNIPIRKCCFVKPQANNRATAVNPQKFLDPFLIEELARLNKINSEFTKPRRQRQLYRNIAFVSKLWIQNIPCFSLEFASLEALKLSFSISRLGYSTSGVLYCRSMAPK